jgi:hypothetical protein
MLFRENLAFIAALQTWETMKDVINLSFFLNFQFFYHFVALRKKTI